MERSGDAATIASVCLMSLISCVAAEGGVYVQPLTLHWRIYYRKTLECLTPKQRTEDSREVAASPPAPIKIITLAPFVRKIFDDYYSLH